MATINPHTTRAVGTVLTASIYNADHVNHVTNSNALNAELLTTPGNNGFVEGSTPSPPPAGRILIYAKADKHIYQLDSAGLETDLASAPGGGTIAPQGRLCLLTGTPVHITDQLAKTSIFYTPYMGSLSPSWNGAVWSHISSNELSLALTSNSGFAGYHQVGKNFDLWLEYVAGVARLVTGPAWTSDVARVASGEIVRQNGIWLNNASMLARFGTGSGDTTTIATKRATWVGTFRASADGQTEMSINPAPAAGGTNNKLFLWNAYNRRQLDATCRDSTDSWTLANGVKQAMNAGHASLGLNNRISFVTGLAEDSLWSSLVHAGSCGGGFITTGVGLDSITSIMGRAGFHNHGSNVVPIYGDLSAQVQGFHFFQAIESHQFGGAPNATLFGDSGVADVQTGLSAELWM